MFTISDKSYFRIECRTLCTLTHWMSLSLCVLCVVGNVLINNANEASFDENSKYIGSNHWVYFSTLVGCFHSIQFHYYWIYLFFSKLSYMLKHANHLWIAHDRNAMEGNTKQTENQRKKKQQTEREKNRAAKIEAKIVVFCNRTQCGVLCAYEFIELDVYVVILSVAKETERNSLSQALIQHRTCFNITSSSRRISHRFQVVGNTTEFRYQLKRFVNRITLTLEVMNWNWSVY